MAYSFAAARHSLVAAPPQPDRSLQFSRHLQPSISQPSASEGASVSQPGMSQHSVPHEVSLSQPGRSEPSMSQEEIREVLLLHQCPAPKRLLQGIQYMVEQRCFPCGRGPLSSWLQQLASLEDRTTLSLRALLPGCYHIMMRSVKEISDSRAALESLLSFSPQQVDQYVSQNPHLLYKTAPHLFADFDALLQLMRLPREKLLAMAASHPGLLGHTHDGLRLKWQRLQIAASTSARWQAEISGDDVDLSLLASTACAPHADLDRLTYLCAQSEQETHSLVQAVTCTDAAFRQAHPGYKEFQLQHALLGGHYAACTHPTQRLLLEGGASLPRGSAGRWVNLFLQQRGQREANEELEAQRQMYLEWQHALALELVQQDEWNRALGL
ncbi:hypothetical protein DUNSADRAFT_1676 [Dunaliella salina]|uniref:Uncharacterized protein n=1 Tax=Dunaliella salina TaxID=3046 RepID=A0ABQ7GWS4_DUNSA|nr:hypothetical protein DUNSADRAFT_1676 [Dunaliella salina]|eukprot:KAF5839059.1 hypothetical protein DUNSADRAFT_1676 [Dunaliella salina]